MIVEFRGRQRHVAVGILHIDQLRTSLEEQLETFRAEYEQVAMRYGSAFRERMRATPMSEARKRTVRFRPRGVRASVQIRLERLALRRRTVAAARKARVQSLQQSATPSWREGERV